MEKKENAWSTDFGIEKNLDRGNEFREKGPDCPSGEQLAALVDHKCSQQEKAIIQAHIKECDLCKKHCMTIASFKMSAMRTPTTSKNGGVGRWGCFLIAVIITLLIGIGIHFLLKR